MKRKKRIITLEEYMKSKPSDGRKLRKWKRVERCVDALTSANPLWEDLMWTDEKPRKRRRALDKKRTTAARRKSRSDKGASHGK